MRFTTCSYRASFVAFASVRYSNDIVPSSDSTEQPRVQPHGVADRAARFTLPYASPYRAVETLGYPEGVLKAGSMRSPTSFAFSRYTGSLVYW